MCCSCSPCVQAKKGLCGIRGQIIAVCQALHVVSNQDCVGSCSALIKQCCSPLPLQEGMKRCMAASLPAWAGGHGTAAVRRQPPCSSRGPWLPIKAPTGQSVWGRPSRWLLLRSMLPAGQLAYGCML